MVKQSHAHWHNLYLKRKRPGGDLWCLDGHMKDSRCKRKAWRGRRKAATTSHKKSRRSKGRKSRR